jgi:hypothetical protein
VTPDIIETRRASVSLFTAYSDRGRLWMRANFGRIEVSYGALGAVTDFRKQARKAQLLIYKQPQNLA